METILRSGIKLTMPAENAERLVRECFDNFPEASISFHCPVYKYQEFRFEFVDLDTKERYTIYLPQALKGLAVFIQLRLDGKLKGLDLGPDWLTDAGDWDGDCFDALAQCAIFGEVRYG